MNAKQIPARLDRTPTTRALLAGLLLVPALAATPPRTVSAQELWYGPPVVVSNQSGVMDTAQKARILRLVDGTLLVAYADAGAAAGQNAWDLFGQIHPAHDIFITWSRNNGLDWSAPINISNTASRTDAHFFRDPDGTGTHNQPYYGDSSKPSVFAPGNGNTIVVTWIDRYCPSGSQGVAHYPAEYPASGEIDVPFGCLYAARLLNNAKGVSCLLPDCAERLTDASRDAIQDVPRATGAGFAIAWQEDPLGLQPGEAEGPGDGGSGARVSHGTDIWYTHISMQDFVQGRPWTAPVPISDNAGTAAGASRPGLALVRLPGTPAQAVLVYEETKASDQVLEGKYAVLHNFTYDKPPQGDVGTIISDPLENARRLRVVAKSEPGPEFGTRMIVFWRQGKFDSGGPADIMARIGRVPAGTDLTLAANAAAGLGVADLYPAVDPASPGSSLAALNLSAPALDHPSDLDPIDDARAHRALLDGDTIAFAYVYTPDQPVARYTTEQNYNLYIRRSMDSGRTWSHAANVSNVTDTAINVIEPRLVGTPATVTGSTLAEDQREAQVFYLAWGTQINQYEAIAGPSVDLDLYITRTTDFGLNFEPARRIAQGTDITRQNGEIQLRTTPDGTRLFAVWIETHGSGTEAVAANAKLVPTSSGASGCSIVGTADAPDPLLPLLVVAALAAIRLRSAVARPPTEVSRALPDARPRPRHRFALPTRRQRAPRADAILLLEEHVPRRRR